MHEIRTETIPPADPGRIRRISGSDKIREDYDPYLMDESRLSHRGADYLYFPEDEAQLSSLFKEMGRKGRKVTISGARTGIVGGAVPFGGAVVSLERFDRILGIRLDRDSNEWRVRTECGVTLKEFNERLTGKHFPELYLHGSQEDRSFLKRYTEDSNAYFYPPDPTETGATMGGTVSANASGARTYKYGATRNWVRAIRVILASGEALEIPRGKHFPSPEGKFTIIDGQNRRTVLKVPSYKMPDIKNAAGIFAAPGMDLIDLFIGSEGILGAITEAEVALEKWVDPVSLIQFFPSDEHAVDFVTLLRQETALQPDFIEFYSANGLKFLREKQDVSGFPEIPANAASAIFFDIRSDTEDMESAYARIMKLVSRCGSSPEWSWAGYEHNALERFKNFRHVLPEIVNSIIAERKNRIPGLHKLGTDLAVPDRYLKEIWNFYKSTLEEKGLEWVAFGHIGNNHIHINIMPGSPEELNTGTIVCREFAKKAVALGGTVSAEHGIGKLKKDLLALMYPEKDLQEMKALKLALDPNLMLNPGNVLD